MLTTLAARLKAHSHRHSHRRRGPVVTQSDESHLEPCTPGVDCEDCPNRATKGSTLPLCLVGAGERARIIQVDEGHRFRRRLADLGLAVGMEVRVVQASRGAGPLILAVCNDSRLAVGWGMANKIRVQVKQS
jgi:Fe2+ transport system protein FeoA